MPGLIDLTGVILREVAHTDAEQVQLPGLTVATGPILREDLLTPGQALQIVAQATEGLPGPVGRAAQDTEVPAEVHQGVLAIAEEEVPEVPLAGPQEVLEALAARSEVEADAQAEADPEEEEEDDNLIRLT